MEIFQTVWMAITIKGSISTVIAFKIEVLKIKITRIGHIITFINFDILYNIGLLDKIEIKDIENI